MGRLYTPRLYDENVRRLYQMSRKLNWTMVKTANHIINAGLTDLENTDLDECEVVEIVARPEEPHV